MEFSQDFLAAGDASSHRFSLGTRTKGVITPHKEVAMPLIFAPTPAVAGQ
jgi:hypothetical protein